MADSTTDEKFLQRALALARQGIGLASPNPCVGAVIVDSAGTIVGEGFHTYDGIKHAEVIALEQAGERARGATLYINLEPCSHQGRTGPCADAVIAAGIRRVVAGMSDPNPQVTGAGFERLRAAGVEVEIGSMNDEAKKLNESFTRYIRHHIPLVTLKAAMTLDGKIAPPPSASPQLPTHAITAPMHITGESWSALARSLPTILCSPIAAASRAAVLC
jgi:diaminohydroxyphosphoribosylaminopyrimidine deaminase/5-amino-6-(5-phosphoribosylamino)uracil reductase